MFSGRGEIRGGFWAGVAWAIPLEGGAGAALLRKQDLSVQPLSCSPLERNIAGWGFFLPVLKNTEYRRV